ncbi:hypothetical protein G9A89_017963 [Geosiphon pyriformis]|nr:hypothetical protein G9A89_017963 [Geosiphon pyriformis]
MESGSNVGVKLVEFKKKRRSGALEDSVGNRKIVAITDMEEKFLVKETSFDYGEGSAFTGRNSEQTPKSLKIQTKRALGKLLGKIDFLSNNDNNIFLDKSVILSSPLKNLVNVSVHKSFALDIGLNKQKAVVEFKQSDHTDWSQVLLYILLMKTNTHDIWDFVGFVSEKKCVINRHSVMYAQTRCAVICFDSVESLDVVMRTTPVLKGANLHWSCLVFAGCTKYKKSGYMSLDCAASKKVPSGVLLCKVLLDMDKSRLAAIYAKCLASVAHLAKIAGGFFSPFLSSYSVLVKSGSFLKIKPSLLITMEINDRFATLEYSFASLAEQVSKLAKKLNTLGPMVFQPSPGSQLLVTFLSQDHRADIIISKDLGASISNKTVVKVVFFDVSLVSKLEDNMRCLMEILLSLLAKVDSLGANLIAICNVREMNNPVKQDDVIYWHKDINNVISIFTELKLREKVHSWIVNKFDGIWVFTSGLESGYLSASVVIIMDSSLAKHVCKISEVSGQLLSIKLLFKNKLSVSILGLYAGASSVTVNESFFIILESNFNENGLYKSASFKRCLDLELVNSLLGSPNLRGVEKTIDYVLVLSNLVNAVVECNVLNVSKHFDTDHQAVSVSLISLHKQANKDHWKFDFKDATAANAAMFSDDFVASKHFSDLDTMWDTICKMMCLSANENIGGAFESLMGHWETLDANKALLIQVLVDSGVSLDCVYLVFFSVQKSYYVSKLAEFLQAEKLRIKLAIDRQIENFVVDKGHTIRSVLKYPFQKVVLDHLVVENELILESNLVKAKMDDFSNNWHHQYQPLEYIFDNAFSSIMCSVSFSKLISVVFDLPNDKAASLSGISNKLWKQCDKSVLDMLLTTCKILFKVLLNRISLACSTFDESVCEYRLNFHFVSSSDCVEFQVGLSSFFATGAFIDDIIWIGSSQSTIQHILNVASEFFQINDISINNDKTVVIPINNKIKVSSLSISGSSISITKRGESHQYLGIFLFTKSFLKPSLAKTHSDVCFFANLVLKKAVSDKQFLYLVLAVLHPIISYRIQFSFVSFSVYSNLVCLSIFLAIQFTTLPFMSKSKVASFICFVNSVEILGCLFSHKFYDIQVLCWHSVHLLSSPVYIHVSTSNNFLVDMVCIFLDCNLFLGGFLAIKILQVPLFSLAHWKRLDSYGPVSEWFKLSTHLSQVGTSSLFIYMDESLKELGTVSCKAGTAAFFKDINLGLDINVLGLMSSTLAEIQAIALVLECIPLSSSVHLYSDSQSALDACKSELDLNLRVSWHKVKSYSGISGNECANTITGAASISSQFFHPYLSEHFLMADGSIVSGNFRHFVHDVFRSVCHTH